MDNRAFDLNLLKTFDALMSERHVTRAGRRIGLSQSAVSGALSRLRQIFDDELFIRTPTGMQPTPRARDLAQPIADALNLVDRALGSSDDFDAANSNQRFTLGMSDYTAFVLLPTLMVRLQETAPGVAIDVRGMLGRDAAVDLLDRGEVDLAIGIPPKTSRRIVSETLFEESFACICRTGHPAFTGGGSLDAFANARHLLISPEGDRLGLVDKKLAAAGRKRQVFLSLPQFLVAPEVVAGSDHIATVATRVAQRFAANHASVELHAPPIDLPGFPIAMLWHRRADANPATHWLRRQLGEIVDTSAD